MPHSKNTSETGQGIRTGATKAAAGAMWRAIVVKQRQ